MIQLILLWMDFVFRNSASAAAKENSSLGLINISWLKYGPISRCVARIAPQAGLPSAREIGYFYEEKGGRENVIVIRRLVRCAAIASVCGLGAACSAPGPSLVGQPVPETSQYIIGPGDSVNIFVYRSPELSAEVPVRPDGRISTPLAPDVLAMGKTPSQLAAAIEERLKKYVNEPTVTVMLTGIAGAPNRQIRVIGEVAQPLILPYRADLSLVDVMIAAKGLTRFAAGNRAVIVRQDPEGSKSFSVRLDDLLKDGDVSQNVAMQPGDTLFVPQAWF